MTDSRGKFIVFEGLDGSGKTTQLKRAAAFLRSRGIEVVTTKEPQEDRPTGVLLRRVLSGSESADPRVVAALFAADRLDHLTRPQGILQTLERGAYVLCDRYYLSNYAYNSVDADPDWITAINAQAVQMRRPDLHIYIDVTPETALARISNRGEKELYENSERLSKVRANYRALIDRLRGSETIFEVDGMTDSSVVFSRIRERLTALTESSAERG